jgi:hypothetical protein
MNGIDRILRDVLTELARGDKLHGRHPSLAHGVEVQREEFDEFVVEARRNPPNPHDLYRENIHNAAMAVKVARDCTLPAMLRHDIADATERSRRMCDTCRHDGVSMSFCLNCDGDLRIGQDVDAMQHMNARGDDMQSPTIPEVG